jgi:hypothetical protein
MYKRWQDFSEAVDYVIPRTSLFFRSRDTGKPFTKKHISRNEGADGGSEMSGTEMEAVGVSLSSY